VWIGRMIISSSLSIIYTAVDSFRHRASLILTGIEILPNLSILAILCIMGYWGLLGLRVLSAVGGFRMEFSSRTPSWNDGASSWVHKKLYSLFLIFIDDINGG